MTNPQAAKAGRTASGSEVNLLAIGALVVLFGILALRRTNRSPNRASDIQSNSLSGKTLAIDHRPAATPAYEVTQWMAVMTAFARQVFEAFPSRQHRTRWRKTLRALASR